tara:strand:- start:130 stop:621 length:492 start_codon:yes stop_codon:yes gene_type:complete
MKITKSKLKQIIKEELNRVLNESPTKETELEESALQAAFEKTVARQAKEKLAATLPKRRTNVTGLADPDMADMPNQFWRAMSDNLDIWIKQNWKAIQALPDSQLHNELMELSGALSAVIKDDSKLNSENANKSLGIINTFYPEIARWLITQAEKTFDRLTVGR